MLEQKSNIPGIWWNHTLLLIISTECSQHTVLVPNQIPGVGGASGAGVLRVFAVLLPHSKAMWN